MTIEELTAQFVTAATPELTKLAAEYAPAAEHAIAVGAGAALGAATTEVQKLRTLVVHMATTFAEHHAFMAKMIPALAAAAVGVPIPAPAAPATAPVAAPAPVLTAVPAEGQEQPQETAA